MEQQLLFCAGRLSSHRLLPRLPNAAAQARRRACAVLVRPGGGRGGQVWAAHGLPLHRRTHRRGCALSLVLGSARRLGLAAVLLRCRCLACAARAALAAQLLTCRLPSPLASPLPGVYSALPDPLAGFAADVKYTAGLVQAGCAKLSSTFAAEYGERSEWGAGEGCGEGGLNQAGLRATAGPAPPHHPRSHHQMVTGAAELTAVALDKLGEALAEVASKGAAAYLAAQAPPPTRGRRQSLPPEPPSQAAAAAMAGGALPAAAGAASPAAAAAAEAQGEAAARGSGGTQGREGSADPPVARGSTEDAEGGTRQLTDAVRDLDRWVAGVG